jgi:hypothetical protein
MSDLTTRAEREAIETDMAQDESEAWDALAKSLAAMGRMNHPPGTVLLKPLSGFPPVAPDRRAAGRPSMRDAR